MSMELTHTFTVPASVEETWEAFQDIESVAGCFPGATVTSVEGGDFQGSCKVKLGPIALVYNGSGTFVEKDEAAKRFVVDAKGKDKRGNGTAGAKVSASFVDTGGATEVTVVTDLAITGKPAQFGRGVIQDVSDKLLGQFVACLEQKVGSGGAGAEEAAAAPVEPAVAEIPPEAEGPPVPPPPPTPPPAKDDDALDLGATVLPVLARTYWKQGLAGLLVIAFIIWRIVRD